jgi:hypothetical protein
MDADDAVAIVSATRTQWIDFMIALRPRFTEP